MWWMLRDSQYRVGSSVKNVKGLKIGAMTTYNTAQLRRGRMEGTISLLGIANRRIGEHDRKLYIREKKVGKSIVHLNIRRELIILDTHLHALDTGLQKLPRLQTDPNLGHGQVARPEHASAALCTKLAQDWQSTNAHVSLGSVE